MNGILAGAEIAVIALRGARLDQLVSAKSRRARAVKALRDDPERFLATVQIGITVIGALAGAFGGATFAKDIEPILKYVPVVQHHPEAVAIGLVVVVISYLSLVLGELVPKSLALRYAEKYALLIGPPLLGLSWIARPVVWFLTASSNIFLRFFDDHTTFTESRLSLEELQQLVGEATKTGALDPSAGAMASRALEFPQLSAAHIMVPRSRVVALPRDASVEDIRRVVAESGHTRMPVFEGNLDHVSGYVNVKDVFTRATEKPFFALQEVLRSAYFVAETARASAILEEMKKRRMQIAIVVDEIGMMSGIVTLEDLVEELLGDVFSEHEAPVPESIRREAEGIYLVQGICTVQEVNRALHLDLPIGESYSTIAGYCLYLAQRIPVVGERLEGPDGVILEIVEATSRHVRIVRLHVPVEEK